MRKMNETPEKLLSRAKQSLVCFCSNFGLAWLRNVLLPLVYASLNADINQLAESTVKVATNYDDLA